MLDKLKQIASKLRLKRPAKLTPFLSPEEEARLKESVKAIDEPVKPKPKGRVIKQTKSVEFNPNPMTGGRVVRVMPKQLQKIKQAQEKVEDEAKVSSLPT